MSSLAKTRLGKNIPLPNVPTKIFPSPLPTEKAEIHKTWPRVSSSLDPYEGGGLSLRKNFRNLNITEPSSVSKRDTLRSNARTSLILEPLGEEKDGWTNSLQFLITILSLSVGVPNIWRLPTLAKENDGCVFLLVWILLMCLIGFPLLYIELSLAYFSNKGAVGIWKAVPMLKGVGFVQILIAFLLSFYYPTIGSYAFFYLMHPNDVNQFVGNGTQYCFCTTQDNECSLEKSLGIGEEYFLIHVAKMNLNYYEEESYNIWNILGIVVLVFSLFISLFKGTKMLGYIAGLSSLFTLILLLSFLSLGLSANGLSANFLSLKTAPEQLVDGNLWISASVQSLLSLHLSSGVLLTLGSRTKRYGKYVLSDTIVIFFFNLIVGILSVLLIYCLDDSSSHSYLDSYSFLFSLFHPSQNGRIFEGNKTLFVTLFSLYLLLASFNSLLSILFSLSLSFKDIYFPSGDFPQWIPSLCLTLFVGVISLVFFSSIGLSLLSALDRFALTSLLLLNTFFFLIGFGVFYGKLDLDLSFWIQSGKKFIKTLLWILFTLVPILLLSLFLLYTTKDYWSYQHNNHCQGEPWIPILGWSVFGFGILVIVSSGLHEIIKQIDYGLLNKWSSALKSDKDWGPKDPILQHQWHTAARYGLNGGKDGNSSLSDIIGVVNLNFENEKSTQF